MSKLTIVAGTLIDGSGRTPLKNQAIVIEDGLIQEIFSAENSLLDGEILDFNHATVLPGLIDTHLHITFDPENEESYYPLNQSDDEKMARSIANCEASLRAGVTTIGDCGAENQIIFDLRNKIERGEILGPRILTSGQALVPPGGHGAEKIGKIASGVDEVRSAVREQIAAGADFIKVMATGGGGEDPAECHYDLTELTAIREEAAKLGSIVAAHAHGTQGIRNCVEAGIQRIEHCTFYNGTAGFEYDSQLAKAIAQKGIIVSPTNVIDYRRHQKKGSGAPRAELNQVWRSLLKDGVSFAASSDAGVTDIVYDDFALIPELMVAELGMTPMEAIIACTQTAARALGILDQVGTLEVGKSADLIAISGDLLKDIKTLRKIKLVMKNGKRLIADE